jgi:energy-converting hydrogenase Eha subunit A
MHLINNIDGLGGASKVTLQVQSGGVGNPILCKSRTSIQNFLASGKLPSPVASLGLKVTKITEYGLVCLIEVQRSLEALYGLVEAALVTVDDAQEVPAYQTSVSSLEKE